MLNHMHRKTTKLIVSILLLLTGLAAYPRQANKPASQDEIIYHVFQRSFYDGNGDSQGDLIGLHSKLGYLQQLGVTSILLLPLYQSVYYHNYFASDFKTIDKEFGTMEDFISLVKDLHKRGMKIYLDMETQYVTEDHPWYKEGVGNPKSKYADYLLYDDSAHNTPESIIFGITELTGYDGSKRKVATVNLYSKKVQEYNYQLFKYWIDPNNDGKFDDGVDGFRLDHMMDDLDGKGKLTNLFKVFWNPLITKLKKINPTIKIVAEQANWGSFGTDYFAKGGVDRVFGFRLQQAIASMDKKKIAAMADSTFSLTPAGDQQVVFIENHDMRRFSDAVGADPGKLRVAAALNLFIGGLPSIYYGQELGMYSRNGKKYGNTDANDIPQREAFEWYKSDTGPGMALWYKDSGPWWTNTNLKPNDDISLEEEKNDSSSLWSFYRKLIRVRKANAALSHGVYRTLKNNNDAILSFSRTTGNKLVIVAVNLSAGKQEVNIDFGNKLLNANKLKTLLGDQSVKVSSNTITANFLPYDIEVWEVSNTSTKNQ
jgi:alpha-amylase